MHFHVNALVHVPWCDVFRIRVKPKWKWMLLCFNLEDPSSITGLHASSHEHRPAIGGHEITVSLSQVDNRALQRRAPISAMMRAIIFAVERTRPRARYPGYKGYIDRI
jgi:hypothetical protein